MQSSQVMVTGTRSIYNILNSPRFHNMQVKVEPSAFLVHCTGMPQFDNFISVWYSTIHIPQCPPAMTEQQKMRKVIFTPLEHRKVPTGLCLGVDGGCGKLI